MQRIVKFTKALDALPLSPSGAMPALFLVVAAFWSRLRTAYGSAARWAFDFLAVLVRVNQFPSVECRKFLAGSLPVMVLNIL
ncbi:hypothetical protein NL676_029051 [Syzygium grande]|nr:hypothetical protein NL676_029051 [Syzygium grande]